MVHPSFVVHNPPHLEMLRLREGAEPRDLGTYEYRATDGGDEGGSAHLAAECASVALCRSHCEAPISADFLLPNDRIPNDEVLSRIKPKPRQTLAPCGKPYIEPEEEIRNRAYSHARDSDLPKKAGSKVGAV